ncbi:MAG: kinase-like domain-containing protein [Piptocephalis tieghemiana]|nr:MAG: kinase-like domain-containing protein [Piptocephalis tieghemiana]
MSCPRSHAELVPVLCSLTQAVEWVHAHGIAHLDLRLQNFVHDKGNNSSWRLRDFDQAAFVHEDTVRIMTSCYPAPELLRANRDKSSVIAQTNMDIWSLGCVFWEILMGKAMFEHSALERAVNFHTLGRLINLDSMENGGMKEMIRSMVVVDPKARSTAEALLKSKTLTG